MGYNYADPQAEAWHKNNPKIAIIGTENVSAVGTRGQYVTDRAKGTVSSYDPYTTTGRASAEGWWRFVSARPYISGGFVWTGFDYRGEPSPYQWPNISSQYGVIDTCGFPKDTFYYYQSWWTNKPVLHVFPHWNWPGLEGQEIAVWVHSNLDRVELFHNGQSLGAKDMQKDQHLAWIVKYAPGTIEARGYKDGRQVMTAKRETTGPAAKLVLRPDRTEISADGEDVAICTVEVQDAQGRVVPVTENDVTFKVTGPGEVIGTGNGDPTNHEPDPGPNRKAFAGLCMAIVQSTKTAGTLKVEATSPGLTAATATITSKAVKLRPQVAVWEREVPTGAGITGLWRPADRGRRGADRQSDGTGRRQRGLGVYLPPEREHADGVGGIFGRRRFRGTRRPAGRTDRRRQDGRIQSLLPHREHDLHRNHQRRSDRTAPHRRSGRTRRAWRRTSRGRDRSAPGHRPPARRQRSLVRRRRRRARWAAGTGAYRLAAGRALGHCDRSSLSILTDLLVDFTIVWYFRRIGSSSVTADFFQSSVENARCRTTSL